jgi:hypothetical protein
VVLGGENEAGLARSVEVLDPVRWCWRRLRDTANWSGCSPCTALCTGGFGERRGLRFVARPAQQA